MTNSLCIFSCSYTIHEIDKLISHVIRLHFPSPIQTNIKWVQCHSQNIVGLLSQKHWQDDIFLVSKPQWYVFQVHPRTRLLVGPGSVTQKTTGVQNNSFHAHEIQCKQNTSLEDLTCITISIKSDAVSIPTNRCSLESHKGATDIPCISKPLSENI